MLSHEQAHTYVTKLFDSFKLLIINFGSNQCRDFKMLSTVLSDEVVVFKLQLVVVKEYF